MTRRMKNHKALDAVIRGYNAGRWNVSWNVNCSKHCFMFLFIFHYHWKQLTERKNTVRCSESVTCSCVVITLARTKWHLCQEWRCSFSFTELLPRNKSAALLPFCVGCVCVRNRVRACACVRTTWGGSFQRPSVAFLSETYACRTKTSCGNVFFFSWWPHRHKHTKVKIKWSGTSRSQVFAGATTPFGEDDKMEGKAGRDARWEVGYLLITDEFSLTPIITMGSGDNLFFFFQEKKKPQKKHRKLLGCLMFRECRCHRRMDITLGFNHSSFCPPHKSHRYISYFYTTIQKGKKTF